VRIRRDGIGTAEPASQAHTGVDVSPGTLATLDALLARAPLRLTVGSAGEAQAQPADGLDGLRALTAHIGAGILAAVADGTWPRLKACTAHECRWVYYDRSPAGRSRWCTMGICGSRAKMRAYRSRAR
jgi:predicted RNA-binding Zn ribbon-like protein